MNLSTSACNVSMSTEEFDLATLHNNKPRIFLISNILMVYTLNFFSDTGGWKQDGNTEACISPPLILAKLHHVYGPLANYHSNKKYNIHSVGFSFQW